MKKQQFEHFIRIGAIDSVVIFDRTIFHDEFEVYAYNRGYHTFEQQLMANEIERAGNSIEAERGNRRTWKDLNRAYEFIRSSGWKGVIQIDA